MAHKSLAKRKINGSSIHDIRIADKFVKPDFDLFRSTVSTAGSGKALSATHLLSNHRIRGVVKPDESSLSLEKYICQRNRFIVMVGDEVLLHGREHRFPGMFSLGQFFDDVVRCNNHGQEMVVHTLHGLFGKFTIARG